MATMTDEERETHKAHAELGHPLPVTLAIEQAIDTWSKSAPESMHLARLSLVNSQRHLRVWELPVGDPESLSASRIRSLTSEIEDTVRATTLKPSYGMVTIRHTLTPIFTDGRISKNGAPFYFDHAV